MVNFNFQISTFNFRLRQQAPFIRNHCRSGTGAFLLPEKPAEVKAKAKAKAIKRAIRE